ncbi:MAG: hypothetical protein ABI954_12075 [Pyrinomonadaceae bacterium]
METNDKAKMLAELVKLLAPNQQSNEKSETLSSVWQELATMNNRLATIENQFADKSNRNPALQLAPHPSQERFQIAEANELTLPRTNEKACRFEPDKPCDYCSMCSARGF